MNAAIEDLFFNCYLSKRDDFKSTNIANDKNQMEVNKRLLKKKLSRKQKKQLLRIIDAKDRINEQSNLDSFIAGFKIGLRVGYESNQV